MRPPAKWGVYNSKWSNVPPPIKLRGYTGITKGKTSSTGWRNKVRKLRRGVLWGAKCLISLEKRKRRKRNRRGQEASKTLLKKKQTFLRRKRDYNLGKS